MEMERFSDLLQQWGIKVTGTYPDAYIAGSPERTLQRMAVVDAEARAFILEEVSLLTVGRKREISAMLMSLSISGLSRVHPHLPDCYGSLITLWENRYWQLRPYIPGVPLPRPEYLEDTWRGTALADFLIELRQAASKVEYVYPAETFSIVDFIDTFTDKLTVYNPEVLHEMTPVRDFLADEFFPLHDTLHSAFCHGDYHPLNIIWSDTAMLSVIDWEFCGVKPEAYDLALLIGCLGIENPRVLKGALIRSLLALVRESGIYEALSLNTLPELVMALRFAWLSEWLRKKDREMIRLELDYLRLLLVNRTALASAWRGY